MGVINTRKMNEALLTKWIWRILENREDDLYCKLLRNKYMATKPFALSTANGGSQFWKGIQKIKHLFKWGATFVEQNGKEVLFWKDVWLEEVPLKIIFPRIYDYCRNKNSLVSECLINGQWRFDFTRTFGAL